MRFLLPILFATTLTGCGWGCFEAGTPVATIHGDVPIEAIEVGDVVWSGTEDGRLVQRRVVDTMSRPASVVLDVALGERTVAVTPEHPFFSLSEDDWVRAGDLIPGEALRGLDGRPERVRSVDRRSWGTVVYNLTVEGPEHTFFAGGVSVHNKTILTDQPPVGGSDTAHFSWPDTSVLHVDWVDDGHLPTDIDGDGLPDTGCGDAMEITVVGFQDFDSFDLGIYKYMDWTGEDCVNRFGRTRACHRIGPNHTLLQVESCRPEDVVYGETTFFDASYASQLTLYLAAGDDCYVQGPNRAYYASLGCLPL